jgi:hypothetical protein
MFRLVPGVPRVKVERFGTNFHSGFGISRMHKKTAMNTLSIAALQI